MPTNEILTFATAGGANVQPQATYAADPQRVIGNQPGIAKSAFVNKAVRQATFVAAALAQLAADTTGSDVLDDGNVPNLEAIFQNMIALISAAAFVTKDPVSSATTANITLSGVQTIDGVSGSAGQRVLVKNQTSGQDNGIYTQAVGSWVRASDFDNSAEVIPGCIIPVIGGTVNGNKAFQLLTTGTIIVGTTALNFSILSGGGITALTGNVAASGNGSVVATIQPNVVDNTMLAQMAARTLKGNNTGSTANTSDLTIAQAMAIINALTGYTSGAGTVSAADSVLTAIQKLNGNIAAIPASPFTQTYAPADQAIVFGTGNNLSHGLGVVPKVVECFLICTTAEGGYSVGDIVTMAVGMNLQAGAAGNTGFTQYQSNTQVGYRIADDGYRLLPKTTGTIPFGITATSWNIRVRAYA